MNNNRNPIFNSRILAQNGEINQNNHESQNFQNNQNNQRNNPLEETQGKIFRCVYGNVFILIYLNTWLLV